MSKNKLDEPNLFKIGTMIKPKTYFMHIIKEGNKKIWERMEPCKKYYTIHDNGGRPFLIKIFENTIDIYIRMCDEKYMSWKYYKTIDKYVKIFIGKSPKTKMTTFSAGFGKQFDGNSILIKLTSKMYMFIGMNIKTFSLENDEIINFISPVGNNDVPYPFAIGKKNTYFFFEDTYIDNKYLINKNIKNLMDDYYECIYNSKYIKKLKTKIIQKRVDCI